MARPTLRPLTMADLAVLVAASALALLMCKTSRDTLTFEAGSSSVFSPAYKIGVWPAPAIMALAPSLLVARAIRPRPRWRIVFRQPGTWAALAILVHLGVASLLMTWHASFPAAPGRPAYQPNFNTYLFANRIAGSWVAVAWATLAVARAWRAEPSWIDRSGRTLGVVAMLVWLGSSLIG